VVDVQKQCAHMPNDSPNAVHNKAVLICTSMYVSEPIMVANLQKKWKSILYQGIDYTTHGRRSTEVNHIYDSGYERAGTERYQVWRDGGSKVSCCAKGKS
jgi:hypothetical protein